VDRIGASFYKDSSALGLNLAMLIFFLSSFQNMGIVIIFWLPGNYIWQLYLISLIISSRSSGFYWLSVCYVEACHLGFSLSYCVNPSTTKAVRYMFTFALLYLCMQIYVLSIETYIAVVYMPAVVWFNKSTPVVVFHRIKHELVVAVQIFGLLQYFMFPSDYWQLFLFLINNKK
jgi:hypothetical protein